MRLKGVIQMLRKTIGWGRSVHAISALFAWREIGGGGGGQGQGPCWYPTTVDRQMAALDDHINKKCLDLVLFPFISTVRLIDYTAYRADGDKLD